MNNVAIFGYGVVGKGVFEILKNQKDVNIKYVFDLPTKKDELKDLLETDYKKILDDKSIDTVFECMGNDTLPYQIITYALNKKINVITSNKETVSKHYDEYISLAKDNNCEIRFEASVGGGIPLIKPLNTISKFDEALSFKGILNGTTNFILTKVFYENMDFDSALKLAQKLGFAEADPTSDLEGLDLKRKGIILSSLLFNNICDYDDVVNFGIKNLNNQIVNYVKDNNKVMKLIVKGNNKNQLIVMPEIITKDNILANISNEFNGIIVDFKYNNKLTFIGKGAGKDPTASAMVADMYSTFKVKRENPKKLDIKFEDQGKYLVFSDKLEIKEINKIEELKGYSFIAKIGE